MNGQRKVEITNQQLYELYLSKKHKLASATLYFNAPALKPIFTQENNISSVSEVK